MRFGLTSSGFDGLVRATRNAASAPPPRTTTITRVRTDFSGRACSPPSSGRIGPGGLENQAREVAGQRGGGLDAGAQADAAEGVADHRESRQARDGVVDGAHAREVGAVVLRDAGAGAPDAHEVGSSGGARRRGAARPPPGRRWRRRRTSTSAGSNVPPRSARRSTPPSGARPGNTDESYWQPSRADPFAARDDEAVASRSIPRLLLSPWAPGHRRREIRDRRPRPARGGSRGAPRRRPRERAAPAARRSPRRASPGRPARLRAARRPLRRARRPSRHRRGVRAPGRARRGDVPRASLRARAAARRGRRGTTPAVRAGPAPRRRKRPRKDAAVLSLERARGRERRRASRARRRRPRKCR